MTEKTYNIRIVCDEVVVDSIVYTVTADADAAIAAICQLIMQFVDQMPELEFAKSLLSLL